MKKAETIMESAFYFFGAPKMMKAALGSLFVIGLIGSPIQTKMWADFTLS
jgi:hypothetical protein